MKKILFKAVMGLIIQLILIPAAYPQKSVYESRWQAGQSPKDGEEFVNKMQFENKSQFLFYISNDEKNLYICLITADQANIQKIMRYGLTTWFNADAKQKKGLGLQFPVPADELAGPPAFKEGGKPGGDHKEGQGAGGERKEMMNRMLAGKNKEMVLIGFSGKGIRDTIQLKTNPDFQAQVEMLDGGKVLVSLAVPLSRIETTGKVQNDNQLSIGFETGYMDLNQSGIGASGSSQSSEGHGGGMYGGPPGGGGQPSGGMDKAQSNTDQQKQTSISDLANPTKLWISPVKLAVDRK
jgi:hypothetical protein